MYAAQFAQLSVLSVADSSGAAVGFADPPVEHAASASAVAPAPAPESSARLFSCELFAWAMRDRIIGSAGSSRGFTGGLLHGWHRTGGTRLAARILRGWVDIRTLRASKHGLVIKSLDSTRI